MITLFTVPKRFEGEIGRIQEIALRSWLALEREAQIVLVCHGEDVAAAARKAGVEHVSATSCGSRGAPRLDEAFAEVDRVARYPLRLFVNADIVLLPGVLEALERVAALRRPFLIVGETRDLSLDARSLDDAEALRVRALREGAPRGAAAIDWFGFSSGLFDPLPPFLVGRATFDNWMLWHARQSGIVVDATRAVVAIHQPHTYEHLAGGRDEAYHGEEATENLRVGGGRHRLYTLHDASHTMRADGRLVRNYRSMLRVRATVRRTRSRTR